MILLSSIPQMQRFNDGSPYTTDTRRVQSTWHSSVGLPSLIQPGKKWRWEDEHGDWWQTVIVDHYGGDPDMVSFEARRIEIIK